MSRKLKKSKKTKKKKRTVFHRPGLSGNGAEDRNTIDAVLQQIQAGDHQQAEETCQQILAKDPAHADALHCLGLIAFYAGHFDLAME